MVNAPSHVTLDLVLTNVTVQALPPNTTSKVQSMDTGIIATFKRHYRRLHLQNVLDRDDAGAADLYKVDQVTAMRWSLIAWSKISSTTNANRFKHTGLMNGPTLPAVEAGASAGDIQLPVQQDADLVYQEEQEVEKDMESILQRLLLRNRCLLRHCSIQLMRSRRCMRS
uniref:DDE-1 domain-containing protein n=1 Tax=Peronospora matthiolae TaxID=2874970 RepID=A0AAV1UF97_9STRA